MPPRKLALLAGLVLAGIVVAPSAAMGAAMGTDRPLTGTTTSTATINLVTLSGTIVSSGQLSLLGKVTTSQNAQFALVGPNGFSWTGTETTVAANGDQLFATVSGAGTLGPPIQSTAVHTITGGTGRFAHASGTFTTTAVSSSVSIVGSVETVTSPLTFTGTISY